jgi:hypothetical protein
MFGEQGPGSQARNYGPRWGYHFEAVECAIQRYCRQPPLLSVCTCPHCVVEPQAYDRHPPVVICTMMLRPAGMFWLSNVLAYVHNMDSFK